MKFDHRKTKKNLRHFFLQKRNKIPQSYRDGIREELLKTLLVATQRYDTICSFASKDNEINLWQFNEELAKNNRLILPKVSGQQLLLYYVKNIEEDLIINTKLNLLEPDDTKCEKVDKSELRCILTPGLAFDKKKHRLGYGMGCYDRLLKELNNTYTVGIGFKEQFTEEPLPVEEHDIFLQELYLF